MSPLNHHARQAWSKQKSSSHNNRSWHQCLEEDLCLLTGPLNNLQIWRIGTEEMIVSFVKKEISFCRRKISRETANIARSASSPYLISLADCRLPADILSGSPREHGNCLIAFKHEASWSLCLWPCWRSGLELAKQLYSCWIYTVWLHLVLQIRRYCILTQNLGRANMYICCLWKEEK